MPEADIDRLRPLKRLLPRLVLILAASIPSKMRADDVVLRSGMSYRDVKTEARGELHRIVFQDGRVLTVPNAWIRSLRPAPVTWTTPARKLTIPLPPERAKPARTTRVPLPPKREPPRPAPAPEGNPPDERRPLARSGRPGPIPWTPVLKSAVLPGWGQQSTGRPAAGALFAASSIYVLQRYWSVRQQHATAEAAYNDPLPVSAVASQTLTGALPLVNAAAINLVYLSEKEQRVRLLEKQGNSMVLAFSLLWGWNMLDILHETGLWKRVWRHSRSDPGKAMPVLYWQKDSISAAVVFAL